MSARANSQWIGRVRSMLADGLGVEDIAVRLSCDVEAVRREVSILRESGDLDEILGRSSCTRRE